MQVFVGWESVVDADQLDRQPRHWAFSGFRLLGSSLLGIIGLMTPGVRRPLLAAIAIAVAAATLRTSAAPVQDDISTLPNGLTVVLSEDHSTPIVHLQLWYHVGSKNEKAGRTGFAHLFEHLMFKGSKNVEPEEHTSFISRRRRAEQRLHDRRRDGVLGDGAGAVSAAGAVARSRSDGDAAHRQGHVRQRARGREGRAADAGRQPAVRPAERDHLRPGVHDASLQAPDDRQHGGSRSRVDRRRARFLPDVLRAGERDGGPRRRLRHGAGEAARRPVSRPRAEGRASGAARHPEGAAADRRRSASRCRSRGRCRPSSSRITSPTTATPTRIRCTSRRRCCRTARARASTRSWSTRSSSPSPRSAARTSSRIRTCSTPWRSCSRATRPRRRRTRSSRSSTA